MLILFILGNHASDSMNFESENRENHKGTCFFFHKKASETVKINRKINA